MNLLKAILVLFFFISSIWCNAQDNGTFWTSAGVSEDGFGENKYYNSSTGKSLHGGFLVEFGYSHKVWKYVGLAGLFRNQFYFYKDLDTYDYGGKVDYHGPFQHHTLLAGLSGYVPIDQESAIELRVLAGPFWRVTPKVVVTSQNYSGYSYSKASSTVERASGFSWAYLFGAGYRTKLSPKVTFMVSLDLQLANPDFKSVQYRSTTSANVYTPAYTYNSKSYNLVFGFGFPL